MKQIDGDALKQFSVCPETAGPSSIKSMVAELQSRRAAEQAALPAVEEMAEKLTRFVEAKISAYLPGDITLPDDEARAIRELLAPLYAKLASQAELLGECSDWISHAENVLHGAQYSGGMKRCDDEGATELRKQYNESLSDKLDALLGAKGGS